MPGDWRWSIHWTVASISGQHAARRSAFIGWRCSHGISRGQIAPVACSISTSLRTSSRTPSSVHAWS
jgi:hypothetical protein